MGYIYMLMDTRNGKKYIGQHNGSRKSYWSGGLIPNRIADVHGKDIFERVILEDNILNEDLGEREKYYIKKYNTLNDGYNLTEGGDGGNTITNHPNKEDIVTRISETLKGRVFTDEHKEKLKLNHMSKDPENRKKLSEALRGYNKTEEHKSKISKTISELNKKLGRWSGDDNPLKDQKTRERISNKNRERAFIRRKENINNFIEDFNGGKINENNIHKYNQKIWNWTRDLGDDELNKLIPKNVFDGFNKLRQDIVSENIKKRSLNHKGFKHSDEAKQKISEKNKKEFLEYCNNIYETTIEKGLEYLIECYSKDEYTKIRSKIKNSVFLSQIPKHISDKILNLKPKKKVVKNTNPDKFYGNKTKEVIIEGILYGSVSDASNKLNMDRGTIRYRLKSIKYNRYIQRN
jgi:hypothetical protein